MQTDTPGVLTPSKTARIAGWIASGLVILFLLFDSALKFANLPVVQETMEQLGWPPHMSNTLGILTLLCTALYAFPPTSVLGATLMTGYLGGAIAAHVRVGSPLFTHILFGVYLALLLWGGLFLREPRLRALLPFRVNRL